MATREELLKQIEDKHRQQLLAQIEAKHVQLNPGNEQGTGVLEAGLRGGAQGLPLVGGYTDEAEAALKSAFGKDTYPQARKKVRDRNALTEKEHPYVYNGAQFASSLPVNMAKMIPGAGAGVAALEGAINGVGYSDADLTKGEVGKAAFDAWKGATVGKLAHMAPGGISQAIKKFDKSLDPAKQKIADYLKWLSQYHSAHALGAERGTIKKLGKEKVAALGDYGLNEGIVTPWASTQEMIARNAAKQKEGGELMGKVYNTIDNQNLSSFQPASVRDRVDSELGGFWRDAINKGKEVHLDNTLNSIEMRAPLIKNSHGKDYTNARDNSSLIPLMEAQRLKETIGGTAHWKNNLKPTPKEEVARQAYGIVNNEIDNSVDSAMRRIRGRNSGIGSHLLDNSDELGRDLARGKSLYGNGAGAEELLTNKDAREAGHKLVGLTDWGALGPGFAHAEPLSAAAFVAKKGGEKYGSQLAAHKFKDLSKKFEKVKSPIPGFEDLSPQPFRGIADKAESIGKQGNLAMGTTHSILDAKYSKIKEDAAKEGPEKARETDYILQQTPDYRMMKKAKEEGLKSLYEKK